MLSSFDDKLACLTKIFGPGTLMGNRRNVEFRCPVCAPKERSKRKLSIRIDDGVVNCWVCGTKGMHPIFIVRKHFSRAEEDLLLQYYPLARARRECIIDVRLKPKLMDDFALLALHSASRDPDVRACHRYVRARGLSSDDCWRYRLGFSRQHAWSRRVILPSFDATGELNYYTGRAIDASARLRYNTVEADRSKVIFNEIDIDWSRQLVVCEGPFDMLKCGDNAVPLLGNSLNEDSALFCSIVAHRTPIALALDSDMRRRTLQLVKQLESYNVNAAVVDLGGKKDPGEMSRDEFAAALSRAKPVEWRDSFLERLNRASSLSMRVH